MSLKVIHAFNKQSGMQTDGGDTSRSLIKPYIPLFVNYIMHFSDSKEKNIRFIIHNVHLNNVEHNISWNYRIANEIDYVISTANISL